MTNIYEEFLILESVADYKRVYDEEYCQQFIYTHDGICVRFYPETFEHAFYSSEDRKKGDKSIFSNERAKRILWIRKALLDTNLSLYEGWIKAKKQYDSSRRVCLVTPENYVIVIQLNNKNVNRAKFITAYLCDDEVIANKIKSSPHILEVTEVDTV